MIKKDILRVIKNSSYLIGVQATNYLVPFLVLPFISRAYSHDVFGLILITLAICQLGYMLTEFGFNVSLVDKIKKGLSINEIWLLTINIIIIRFIVSLTYIIIIAFFLYKELSIYYLICIFGSIFVQSLQPIWYYSAIEEFKKVSIILLITKLCQVPAFFILIFFNIEPVLSFLISILISQIIGSIYSLKDFYIAYGKCNVLIDNKGLRTLFNENYGFFFSRIYTIVPYYIGSPIVGRLYSINEASLFGAGDSLGRAAKGLTGTVIQAFYPRISESKKLKLFFIFYFLTTFLIFIIVVFSSLYSEDILSFIYGVNYKGAAVYLKLSLVVVLFSYSNSMLGYPLFSLIENKEIVNKITFITFGIFLILIIFVVFYKLEPLFFLYSLILMEALGSIIKVCVFLVLKRNSDGC